MHATTPRTDSRTNVASTTRNFDEDAVRAASQMCGAREAPAEALRVAPRRGMAILFLSAAPHGGAPLPHMWHGGCRVRRGEKWTLQRFKELPRGHPDGGVFSQRPSVSQRSQAWGET